MSDAKTLSGSCLCGAVSFTARATPDSVGACHCTMCRKWGGGPLLAVDCGTDVSLEGEDSITIYPSSAWAERGFCSRCGTHLFYRLKETGQYIVPAGALDGLEIGELSGEIFVDSQPTYYRFANTTRRLTGPEFMAQFAGKE